MTVKSPNQDTPRWRIWADEPPPEDGRVIVGELDGDDIPIWYWPDPVNLKWPKFEWAYVCQREAMQHTADHELWGPMILRQSKRIEALEAQITAIQAMTCEGADGLLYHNMKHRAEKAEQERKRVEWLRTHCLVGSGSWYSHRQINEPEATLDQIDAAIAVAEEDQDED